MATNLIFLPQGLMLYFSKPLLLVLGQDEQIAEMTQSYLRWTLPGVFFYSHVFYLREYMFQLKESSLPTIATTICSIAHVLWCYLLVIYFDYGYIGGALALSITYFINLVILYGAAYLKRDIREMMTFTLIESCDLWWEYFRITIPAVMEIFLKYGFVYFTNIVAGMFKDAAQLGAYVILRNIHLYFFLYD